MISSENDWYDGAAREFSYFSTTEIIKAYNNMNKKYGIAFFNVLFHSNNSIVRMIRKKSELKALIDYIESQSEQFIVKQLEKAYELYQQLKYKLEDVKLNKDTWKEILSLCEELWIYNMFCIYFGYAMERKKIREISNRHYSLVTNVRNDICNLMILENFLKNQEIDLSELSGEEISVFLEHSKLPDDLKERREEYLLFMENLKTRQILQSSIQETISNYFKEKDYSHISELKGITAFQKNVSGIVRIILRKKDLPLLKKGDILVTLTTTLDHVPYLSKVAGIITDYGGFISHAAIIAREMKIPCIVGTKIATKVFKDGDYIEVDANKGIVRKIK